MFARMEKAADSQKQKEAVPTRRPPENPMPVRSFYSMNPQNAPIQMLRKKVADKGDISHSIYWDKRVGKYYTGMKRVSNLAVYSAVWGVSVGGPMASGLPRRKLPRAVDGSIYVEDKNRFVEPFSPKDRVGLNHRYTELAGGFFAPLGIKNPFVFDKGTQVSDNQIFAMRFYAEGDMRHAMGVAAGIQTGAARASPDHADILSPLPLPGTVNKGSFTRDPSVDVTVKATELRTHKDVSATYGDDPATHAVGLANFEGSFGGRTGNMTRTPSAGFKRRYNLIQATFFWIPKTDINQFTRLFRQRDNLRKQPKDASGRYSTHIWRRIRAIEIQIDDLGRQGVESQHNVPYFQAFLRNKANKLKEGGELRVVVARARIYNDAVTAAAQTVAAQFNMDIIDLPAPQKYSSGLQRHGLNPGEQFKHTRTANADEVPATANYGDVIYVFRRKPPSPPSTLPPPSSQPSASTTSQAQ